MEESSSSNTVPYKTQASNKLTIPSLEKQTIDVGDNVYRRTTTVEALFDRPEENITTSYELFKNAVQKYQDRPCMGMRKKNPDGSVGPYEFETYKQVYERVRNIAAGLRKIGVPPSGGKVGLYSINRPEWQIVSEACNTQAMITVSLYDSLGVDSSEYIINHAEIHTLCCGKESVEKVVGFAKACPHLKNVLIFDDITEESKQNIKDCGKEVIIFREVLELGKQNPVDDVPPKPTDLATIMYTSGTTGVPKGVMIAHRNIVASVAGINAGATEIVATDVMLSYLPLAHILERVAEATLFSKGAKIGYWQGNIKEVANDIVELKPTILPAVPRVLDRFYERIKTTVDGGGVIKQYLFYTAFEAKKSAIQQGSTTPFWDYLVFSSVQAKIGGNVRLVLCGGAPLRPEVHDFLRVAFGCPILQGYGLTESTAACTLQHPKDLSTGVAGCVLPCCEVKLVDVPELQYLTKDKTGEVCIRGPNISLGYYKMPKETSEVYDDDGWFHTGDIGKIHPNGSLSIIDRKKNVFKLAHGEYVAVEHIEQKLGQSKYSTRIWLYGDSLKAHLVGVVVVSVPEVIELAKELNIPNATVENISQILSNQDVNKAVLKSIQDIGKSAKLMSFELPSAIHLVEKDFDDIKAFTPTFKLMRNVLKKHFQAEIDKMYGN